MKTLPFFLTSLMAILCVAGCGVTPDMGPPMEKLSGTLNFSSPTALPATAVAHVAVMPVSGPSTKPVAAQDFPVKSETAIPFLLKIPAEKVAGGGEFLVLAQVVDHGKVWYSNVTTPLRISFTAEPGELHIDLRPER